MTHNSNARKARADEPLFGGLGGACEQLIDRAFCDFGLVETGSRTLMARRIAAPLEPDAGIGARYVRSIRSREKDIRNAIRSLRVW